jgi:hypothetical protein
MARPIGRDEARAARAFPPLTEDPYADVSDRPDLSPEQRTARRVLALAGRRLKRAGRLGWRLDPLGAVARLLWLHRSAVRAETAGRVARANFWWTQFREQWRHLPADHPGWGALAATLSETGAPLAPDAAGLRARLGREVFLDTHVAFYNGLTDGTDPAAPPPRAAWHFNRASDLAGDCDLTPTQKDDLEAQVDLRRLAAHAERGEWPGAIAVVEGLIDRDPARFRPLLPSLRRRALDDARGKQDWESALGHAEWLAALFPDEPAFRRLPGAILCEGYKGLRAAGQWGSAGAFAARLNRLFPGRAELQALVEEAARGRVAASAAAGEWDQVLPPAEEMARAPRASAADLQRYVDAVWGVAAAGHGEAADSSAEAARAEAAKLDRPIRELRDFLGDVPQCYPACGVLGLLHQLQAVRLTNGERPSQALLSVAHARAYRPDDETLKDLEKKIEQRLADLGREVADVKRKHATLGFGVPRYGVPQAALLQTRLRELIAPYEKEIENGTKPRDQFRRSAEPKRIEKEWRRARARFFWLRVGLPRPAGEADWDWRAAAFDEATDRLMAAKPANGIELMAEWLRIVHATPGKGLEDIDVMLLAGWFVKQGSGETGQELCPLPADLAETAAPEPTLPAPVPEADGRHTPSLKAAAPNGDIDREAVPFEFWLFSRRDLSAKVAAAAALLLGLLSAAYAGINARAESQRAAAYADLGRATSDLDGEAARSALDRFRSSWPLPHPEDGRLKPLARVQSDLRGWPDLRKRNAAYERLVGAARAGDDAAAVGAAREFLASSQGKPADARLDQVARVLANADEVPNRRTRDAAFKELVGAAARDDNEAARTAAERFLAAPPKRDADPRTAVVQQASLEAAEAPARRRRDRAYADLMAALTASPTRDADAVKAADEFLAAPPDKVAEPRTDQVRELRQYARETPNRRTRDAAYDRLVKAMKDEPLRDADAVKAADEFLAAAPEKEAEPRAAQVNVLRTYAAQTPNRRTRDEAYGRLRAAVAKQDEKGVEAAAKEFLAARGERDADPRDKQVGELRQEAGEWPNRRTRDAAYADLKGARSKGEAVPALLAAEKYLEAPPLQGDDPRTASVRAWYAETFTDWMLHQQGQLDAKDRSRVVKYRSLVTNK